MADGPGTNNWVLHSKERCNLRSLSNNKHRKPRSLVQEWISLPIADLSMATAGPPELNSRGGLRTTSTSDRARSKVDSGISTLDSHNNTHASLSCALSRAYFLRTLLGLIRFLTRNIQASRRDTNAPITAQEDVEHRPLLRATMADRNAISLL